MLLWASCTTYHREHPSGPVRVLNGTGLIVWLVYRHFGGFGALFDHLATRFPEVLTYPALVGTLQPPTECSSPSVERTLPLVDFLVGQGRFLFVSALSIAIAARATTSLALYFLGAQLSEEPLRQVVKRQFERSKLLFRPDLD